MATAAQAIAAIESKLATLTGGTRYASDIEIAALAHAAGATHFRIVSGVALQVEDSNNTFSIVSVEIVVRYRLGASEAESTYTDGDKLTWQLAIAAESWWKSISEIHSFYNDGDPEISSTEREGDILEWSVESILKVQI